MLFRYDVHGGEEGRLDYITPLTALLAHSNGKVYGATSGKAAHLFVYDARVNKVFPLGRPRLSGCGVLLVRPQGPCVQAARKVDGEGFLSRFAKADGSFVGTTSDGFVFEAWPNRNRLVSWGKPRVERRIRAATLGKDGRLYLIAGEKDNVCRLFSFDRENGHLDYGVLGVDRSPYYAKIAYQFDAMCTAADGTVFIGESDRRAKLFFFIPGGEIMPGVLNPTNPR